ncbi:MAG: hypothetical protein CMH57_15860 [Myxococcales bacterium]|nr:hypothetical protein [Myxococcales bacterium]
MTTTTYTLTPTERYKLLAVINVIIPAFLSGVFLIGQHFGPSLMTMAHYDAYMEVHPDDFDATATMANRVLPRQAVVLWNDFIEDNPIDGEAYVRRAWVKQQRLLDEEGARDDFAEACRLGMERACDFARGRLPPH